MPVELNPLRDVLAKRKKLEIQRQSDRQVAKETPEVDNEPDLYCSEKERKEASEEPVFAEDSPEKPIEFPDLENEDIHF